MARKSLRFIGESKPARLMQAPKVHLTLIRGESGENVIGVSVTEFITYSQDTGFTRLKLTGGKVLDVKESTDQIDRMVRAASSQSSRIGQENINSFPGTPEEIAVVNPPFSPVEPVPTQGEFFE